MTIAKARVVKLAKQLYGRNAIIEERTRALDAAGRAAAAERRTVIQARIKELEPIAKGEFAARQTLLAATQFVCDVDAGEPSLSQLKDALAAYRTIEAAIQERNDLSKETRSINTWAKRCNVSEFQNGPIPLSIHVCDGDTWDEVLTKLQAIKK